MFDFDISELRQSYAEKRTAWFNSLGTINTIPNNEKTRAVILDYCGFEGYGDKNDALDDLKIKITEWRTFTDPVTLYRIVGVRNEQEIITDKPGLHWTPYHNQLNDVANSIGMDMWENDLEPYLIKARVHLRDIDVAQTIIQNLSFPNECEITLKEGVRPICVRTCAFDWRQTKYFAIMEGKDVL